MEFSVKDHIIFPVFSLLTGDEKSLRLLPLPQEVPETPVTKETKAKAETKQAKQKKSLFKKKNEFCKLKNNIYLIL